jgi:hypothetical protein
MNRHARELMLLIAQSACAVALGNPSRAATEPHAAGEVVTVIQDYRSGLSLVRAANPGLELTLGEDPGLPGELSVSFLDRNHVAYTTWIDLTGGVWQTVRLPFDQMQPIRTSSRRTPRAAGRSTSPT